MKKEGLSGVSGYLIPLSMLPYTVMSPDKTPYSLLSELNVIGNRHRKTEQKLKEVLQQAEAETNKANGEKEMVSLNPNLVSLYT